MTQAVVFVDTLAAKSHDPDGHPAIVVVVDGAPPDQWQRHSRLRIDGPVEFVQHDSYRHGVQATVFATCDSADIST